MVSWTLDCFSCIQNVCVVRLMAAGGGVRAAAVFVVTDQLMVDLFSSAAAFGGLFNQVTVLAAAAAAAATVGVHALSSLDESAAGATADKFFVCMVQAAAAWVAAIIAVRPVCEPSLLVFSFSGIGSWISLRVCSSFPGLWKEQRNISLQSKDEESSNLQALIQEAWCAEDGQLDTLKGKDRHDTDGSLSLGLGEASGRVDQALRSPQSVVVNQSLRVEKTIFKKGLDGRTTTHRVSEGTMIWEILDDWMIELDMMISFNGKVVGMHDTMSDIGVGHDCTLRCTGRLRGGAQRFRQPQPDIPGQWTCSACGQERVWPVRNRCFRCGFPKGHDPSPSAASPYAVGPTGRPPQRSNPVNPTYRPNQRPHQQVAPTASVQNFPR